MDLRTGYLIQQRHGLNHRAYPTLNTALDREHISHIVTVETGFLVLYSFHERPPLNRLPILYIDGDFRSVSYANLAFGMFYLFFTLPRILTYTESIDIGHENNPPSVAKNWRYPQFSIFTTAWPVS